MMKKISALFLCFSMLLSLGVSVFAEQSASGKTYTLSLINAINMALENDPTYKNLDSVIADAEKQLEKSYKDQKEVKGAIPLPSGLSTLAVKQGYYIEQAKINLEVAKLNKKQYEKRTAYLITQAYFGVKISEESVKTAETAYNLALNNKNNVDLQFSMGLVAELDVKNAQYSLNETKAQLDKSKRNLALSYKSFSSSLFIEDTNPSFVLTDEIAYEAFSSDLIADTTKAIDLRLDLFQLKAAVSQAEKYTNVTKNVGITSAQHSAALQAQATAETNYKAAVRQVDIQINGLYNNIIDSHDALKLAEENYSIRKQEYDVAVIRYDMGIITNSQLISVMNILTNSKIQLDNAKLSYKLAVEKYNYETDIGLGI